MELNNSKKLLVLPIALPIIGVLGGLLNGVGFVDIFQGLYLYTSPILVFYTCIWLNVELKDFNIIKYFVLIIYITNVPAWFYQVVTFYSFDGNGDNVNGLLRDAHLFANFFYFGVIYCFAMSIIYKKMMWGVMAIICFAIGFMAINEKATLFLIPILIIILIMFTGIKLKRLIIPLAVFGVIGYTAFTIGSNIMAKTDTKFRTDVFEENDLSDIGTIVAYIQIPFVFAEVPSALVYGVGAGNYGSSIALRRHVEGTETELSKRYVGDLELAGYVGAFAWRTNYLIGALVEFGLIFTGIFLLFYTRLARNLISRIKLTSNKDELAIIAFTLGSLALLWMTALVSNISNLDEGILVYPIIISAAILYNHQLKKIGNPVATT